MSFASPIWLVLLVPWGVMTLWLLWGRRCRTDVPFLDLWLGEVESPRAKRAMRLPPPALLAAILSVMLAIVAAARPVLRDPTRGPLVTIIVDRGVSMSATGRLAEVIERAKRELLAFGLGPTDLVAVPDGVVQRSDRSDWIGPAGKLEGTSIDTREALARTIREALARNDSPIFVLTDQAVPPGPRIGRIAPTRAIENIAIVHLAVRETPHAQVMVTVRNDSAAERAQLSVESAARAVGRAVDLRPRGRRGDYLVDLPSLGRSVRAKLDVADDLSFDNVRFLAKEQAWPRVEIRSAITGGVQRVVEAYQKARPAGEGSAVVAIASTLRPDERGVLIAETLGAAVPDGAAHPSLDIREHPITANVAWSRIDQRLPVERFELPGPGWIPILSANDIPLLAIREEPTRQIWTTLYGADLAKTTDFVILWTNILDWVASGGEKWAAHDAGSLGREWKPLAPARPDEPGFYRRSDGALRALNAASVLLHPRPAAPVDRKHLNALLGTLPRGIELLPWLIFASIGCLGLAVVAWPAKRLTPRAPTRTV